MKGWPLKQKIAFVAFSPFLLAIMAVWVTFGSVMIVAGLVRPWTPKQK